MRRGAAILAAVALGFAIGGAACFAGRTSGNEEALKEFRSAIDLIKEGNKYLKQGDEERAYDLYDGAITILNGVKGKYPDWHRDKVMKQIKLTLEAKNKLEDSTTRTLEEMRQGRFRFLVWQRQRLILKKLNDLAERLEKVYDDVDENNKYIKDIRDVLETGRR